MLDRWIVEDRWTRGYYNPEKDSNLNMLKTLKGSSGNLEKSHSGPQTAGQNYCSDLTDFMIVYKINARPSGV